MPWTDDLQYMRLPGEDVRFWYSEGDFIKDFGDACRAIYYHHIKITSRLPNYIQCLVNLLPKLVVDISHGLMVGLLVLITAYSIAGRRMLKLTHIVGMSALAISTRMTRASTLTFISGQRVTSTPWSPKQTIMPLNTALLPRQ